jgi:hypothetical protein
MRHTVVAHYSTVPKFTVEGRRLGGLGRYPGDKKLDNLCKCPSRVRGYDSPKSKQSKKVGVLSSQLLLQIPLAGNF